MYLLTGRHETGKIKKKRYDAERVFKFQILSEAGLLIANLLPSPVAISYVKKVRKRFYCAQNYSRFFPNFTYIYINLEGTNHLIVKICDTL